MVAKMLLIFMQLLPGQISFMKLTMTTPRSIHGGFVPSPWPRLGLSLRQMDGG
jgi:hypothetical protein